MRKKLTIGTILGLITIGILAFIAQPFSGKPRGTATVDLSKAGTHSVELPATCCGAPLRTSLLLPGGYSNRELLTAIEMDYTAIIDDIPKTQRLSPNPSFRTVGKKMKLPNMYRGSTLAIHVKQDMPKWAGKSQALVFSQPSCVMALMFLPVAAVGALIAFVTGVMSLTYLVRAYKMWRKPAPIESPETNPDNP
jgi:hypothetical protein